MLSTHRRRAVQGRLASLKYVLSCWNVAAHDKPYDAVKDAPSPFLSPASFLHMPPVLPSCFPLCSLPPLPPFLPCLHPHSLSGSAASEGLFQRGVATAETSRHGSYNSEWILTPVGGGSRQCRGGVVGGPREHGEQEGWVKRVQSTLKIPL